MQKCAAPNYCHHNHKVILMLHYCSEIIPSSNKILNLRVGILHAIYFSMSLQNKMGAFSAISSSFRDGIP